MHMDMGYNLKDKQGKGPDVLRAIALGAFDGLHTAHRAVLEAAARQPGYVPAVLLFDEHPQRALAGLAPPRLLADGDRDALLRELGLEILYAKFHEVKSMSPGAFFGEVLLKRFGAGALCCGYDYRFGAGALGDAQTLRRLCGAHGVLLRAIAEIDYEGAPVSSTRIRQALREGDLEDANAMLGRPFGYAFPVEEGEQIGRTLGFPTLNQTFAPGFAVPRRGVYASQAFVERAWRPGVTNIGTRPSFAGEALKSETHVIGYKGELYGLRIPVRLLRFLRPERKFTDINDLKKQIAADTQNAWEELRRGGAGEEAAVIV